MPCKEYPCGDIYSEGGDHICEAYIKLKQEFKKTDKQLTKICNMILSLDVVIYPQKINEDGMVILKETEFNELFDYVSRYMQDSRIL